MPQLNMEVEVRLTALRIDPVGPRLLLQAEMSEVGGEGRTIRVFHEDVTDQLTANQLTAIANLVAKAEQWVASKAP